MGIVSVVTMVEEGKGARGRGMRRRRIAQGRRMQAGIISVVGGREVVHSSDSRRSSSAPAVGRIDPRANQLSDCCDGRSPADSTVSVAARRFVPSMLAPAFR